SDSIVDFYVELKPTALPAAAKPKAASTTAATTTATSTAPALQALPFELHGKYFPGNVISAAVSPKGNQIFTIDLANGRGQGYITNFDGSGSRQVWDSPLTQVQAFWPATNTLMVATNASAAATGYLYSIDVKTGAV